MIKVVGSINPTDESYVVLMSTGIETWIPFETVTQFRYYRDMIDIDNNIGELLFDQLMFDARFCEDRETHCYPCLHKPGMSPIANDVVFCDCDMMPNEGIFIIETRDKMYVVHPNETEGLKEHVQSKRLKRGE